MKSVTKIQDEIMIEAFEKWNDLKQSLNENQTQFIQKEIEKQENSILTWNKVIPIYLNDNLYGVFNAIELIKDGMSKAIRNGANEFEIAKDTKIVIYQLILFSLLQ